MCVDVELLSYAMNYRRSATLTGETETDRARQRNQKLVTYGKYSRNMNI